MWRGPYSLSYYMRSEWRPVFTFAEMSSAGGSQKPQARPFMKKSSYGSLLEPIMGFWQVLNQNWIPLTQKTTLKWRKRRKKGNCTEWPTFTTFWRCGRAARTYVLPRRTLGLKSSRWRLYDTFQTQKRLSKYPGHSFNKMVWLYLNCQNDHLCHQLCLQRMSLDDELKYSTFTQSEESNLIQSKVIRIAHLIAHRTAKIGLTGMGTWIMQMIAKTIARRTLNVS